ncbi:MAG TPA: cupin domain-containing protein [Vicinamibacterales bacterium]|nr:cupin domain-containing protein [Vicinamibacterales bacterium]
MLKNSLKLTAVALVVLAGSAAAQQAAAPATPTVTRTPLLTQDLPMPGGYIARLVNVELPAGAREGRHVHSGTLLAWVKEGALTLEHEGKPTVTYQVGETFAVEPGKQHEGMNIGKVTTRVIATFVFPKDQPMTTQVK